MVFEALRSEDFMANEEDSRIRIDNANEAFNSTEKCSLVDLRFDQNCDNWTQTLDQKRSSQVVWSSLLANQLNGFFV